MVTSKKKLAKRNVPVGTPVTPVDMDVLLGRGNRVANWPGNVNFRHVINEHRQRYKDAHRSAKGKDDSKVDTKILPKRLNWSENLTKILAANNESH